MRIYVFPFNQLLNNDTSGNKDSIVLAVSHHSFCCLFPGYIDEGNLFTLKRVKKHLYRKNHHNSQHYIYKHLECKKLLDFPVRAHCVNGSESLDLVISGAIKNCTCINNFMFMLCLQPATLLKLVSAIFYQNFISH